MQISPYYQDAKLIRDKIESKVNKFGSILQSFPTNSIGLVNDAHKSTDKYKNARIGYAAAFVKLQTFNKVFVKTFKKEIRAERRLKNV